MITNDQILKVAREEMLISAASHGIYQNQLITFARRIAAMQREIDAALIQPNFIGEHNGRDDRYDLARADMAKLIMEQSDE